MSLILDGENENEIPSISVEVNPVIDNAAITEEFLENIQDSGLDFKNPPHRPFSLKKILVRNCLEIFN